MPAKASRAAFGEALLDLGARDERIVTLDADLSKSTMTVNFAKKYPARAFNLGIAESNMIGVGAGLALTGRIPFACSFALNCGTARTCASSRWALTIRLGNV